VAHEGAESDQDELAKRDDSTKAQLPNEGLNMRYMVDTIMKGKS